MLSLFREHFGITQVNLVIYLSVSLSHLKMVEAGHRELPPEATLKLLPMQLYMYQANEKPDTTLLLRGKRRQEN